MFKEIFNWAALVYFEWALDHIDPLHPDVPFIVQRVAELKDDLSIAR